MNTKLGKEKAEVFEEQLRQHPLTETQRELVEERLMIPGLE
jgi:hypothetical protein